MTDGYRAIFDPDRAGEQGSVTLKPRRADSLPQRGYVYDPDGRIMLAINVAIATGRPLLVRGKPGTGKTSLAADVARRLRWRYYEQTTHVAHPRGRPALDV